MHDVVMVVITQILLTSPEILLCETCPSCLYEGGKSQTATEESTCADEKSMSSTQQAI